MAASLRLLLGLLVLSCDIALAAVDEGDSLLPITKQFETPYYDVIVRKGNTGNKLMHSC